jgi:hypothetical protein
MALEDAIQFAEEKAGQKLPRSLVFQWFGGSDPRITENIVVTDRPTRVHG